MSAAAAAPAVVAKKTQKVATKKSSKKTTQKFTIDCSEPAADDIFDIAAFEKFLHDRIKIAGKTGVLGDAITITRDASQLTVTSKIHISKRYLKYLTKKFLKKQLLRDYIRVIARTKNGYFLRYFNFHNEEEEETDA
jgi:large subunit ribosomal protein L22e